MSGHGPICFTGGAGTVCSSGTAKLATCI